MILSNLISIIIIIVFSGLLYSSTSGYIHDTTDAVNRSEFEYILSIIERNYNEIINISNYIRNNENLKTSILKFNSEETLIKDKLNALKYITDFLIELKNQNKHIKSINIISKSKSKIVGTGIVRRFYTLDYLISIDNSQKLLEEEIEKIYFCCPEQDETSVNVSKDDYLIKDLEKEIYIKFSFPEDNVHNTSGTIKINKDCGNVYIFLNNNFFKEITEGRENLLILDSEKKIIYNGMKKNGPNIKTSNIINNLTPKQLENFKDLPLYNKDMTLYSKTLDNGWTILCYFDKYGFSKKQNQLKTIMFFLLAISFLCSFFLSNSLSKKILRPVKELADFMSSYKYRGEKLVKYNPNSSRKKVTLREGIFYYFLFTIMFPVLLFVMLFNFRIIYWTGKQISEQFMNTFDKTGKYIDEYFQKKLMTFQNIIYNTSMQEFIFNKKYDSGKNSNYFKDINVIEGILRSYKYLGLGNNEIRFYDNNNLVFSNQINSLGDINETSLQLSNINKGYLWYNEKDELNNYIITIATKVSPISISKYSNDSVYAKLRIPVRDVYDIFTNLKTSTSDIFIGDSYGKNIVNDSSVKIFEAQPLYLSEQGEKGVGQRKIKIGDREYLAFYHRIERTPWYLIALYSYHDISMQNTSIITSYIYLLIITFLLVLLLSYMITSLILKSINNLNGIFNNYSFDEIDKEMLEKSFINEIDSLRIAFDNMIERIENLFDDLLVANMEKNQLQLQIKAAEMVALQAQINPHFLYNTLDNLIYLIKNGYKGKACEVVTLLSRLFRFGISRGDRIIPIKEEIAYAKAYASIIKIRYGESIDFVWDVDDSILDYKTIKLILQPLIENAVFHGFKNMQKGCIIWVKCFRKDKTVEFIISDNGEGIPGHKLEEIKKELQSDIIGNKVGIFNVQARIRLQYGKDYGISIDSSEKGTKATITIPLDEEGMEL